MSIIASIKTSQEYDAPDEEGEAAMAMMLARAKHRRECHAVGHRQCAKAKTCAKCPECKSDALQAWDAQKGKLKDAADNLLRAAKAHGLCKRWDR